MPWIVLMLVILVVIGVFIDSFRLFLFALLTLLIRANPKTMLSGIGAVLFWVIKANLRR
jgi:hypothetical protein